MKTTYLLSSWGASVECGGASAALPVDRLVPSAILLRAVLLAFLNLSMSASGGGCCVVAQNINII
jgi:hypothetical protein